MSVKLSKTATKAIKGLSALGNRDPGPLDYDLEMDRAIDTLNREGVTMMQVPEAKRHEAFILDQKMTQAANENRQADFMKYLRQWRRCFH